MKIINSLAIKNLQKNKKRTKYIIIGITLTTMLIISLIILLASYQEYLINIQRSERNYEAEFCYIEYSKALEIAKDKNIKEISIMRNIGTSEENFSKTTKLTLNINISEYDENSIKNNNVNLIEGRFPKNKNEIVVSSAYPNDEIYVGNDIELTINGRKDTYKIVGMAKNLTNDINSGLEFKVTLGALTYFDETEIQDDDLVNVAILTEDIKRIYETTENLANRLKLYSAIEEQNINLKYNNQLLDYSFVNTQGHKVITGIPNIEDINAEEFKSDITKIAVVIIIVIRNLCNINDVYVIQNNL